MMMQSLTENLLSPFYYTAEGMTLASDSMRQAHSSAETAEEFGCDECDMVYKNYKSLWQHKRDNHQDKLSCGYCEYVSSRMYNIKQHRKRRHPNMPDPFDPNVSDLFQSVYTDDPRFEYQPEEVEGGEPPPKMSRKNVTYVEVADIAGNPPMPSTLLQGNNEEREMSPTKSSVPTPVYPVGLTTSREAFHHSGLHGRQPLIGRCQDHLTLIRSECTPLSTSSTLPRITSVTGSSLLNTHPNSAPISPQENLTRMQPSASSNRESTSYRVAQVNNHKNSRESQEEIHQRDETSHNNSPKATHVLGHHQQPHTTISSQREENTAVCPCHHHRELLERPFISTQDKKLCPGVRPPWAH